MREPGIYPVLGWWKGVSRRSSEWAGFPEGDGVVSCTRAIRPDVWDQGVEKELVDDEVKSDKEDEEGEGEALGTESGFLAEEFVEGKEGKL